MQATITELQTKQINTKNGPATLMKIKTKETGTTLLSGFMSDETKDWQVGSIVQLTTQQNGQYMNFRPEKHDKPSRLSGSDLESVHKKLDHIISLLVNHPGLKQEKEFVTD